jgi:hypothetical protein
MADEDDKLEVAVEEAIEEAAEVQTEADASGQSAQQEPEINPEEAINALKAQLAAEKRAREEAEALARQAAQQVNAAYGEVEDTNIQLVNTAIDTVKRENEILTSNYAEAMSMGDYERAAKIQSTMASNSAKLLQLETGLREMQNAPRRAPIAPTTPPASAQLDQIISSVSPRSANWLKSNKSQLSDERMIKKMFRAHEDAVDDGIEPDSDAYFKYIEGRLGLANSVQEAENPMSAAAKPAPRQAPPPPAPVNRETNNRSNVVRLTRAEADTAKMLGMTESEYAKHKIALQKEGKLPH